MKKTVLFVGFLFLSILSKADIIPNPVSASNLKSMDTTAVRMVSEVVSVDLYNDSSIVEVLFEMKNIGKTENVEIGFPIMDYYYGWNTSLFVGQKGEGDRFHVWVDNEPVEDIKIYGFDFREVSSSTNAISHLKHEILNEKVNSTGNGEVNRGTVANEKMRDKMGRVTYPQSNGGYFNVKPWYIWNTNFKEGETRWIKVRYTLPDGRSRQSHFFNYLLHTGAGWNQTIGKVTVVVKMHDIADEKIQRIVPSGYAKNENVISWTFNDLEPTKHDDIFIYYQKENVKPRPSADVYLDNEKTDMNLIVPEDIASINIVKDSSIFPNGAILIHSKKYEFALLKEMVMKYSHNTLKILNELSVDAFYQNYKMMIEDNEAEKFVQFKELSDIESDIIDIYIEKREDDLNLIVFRKR